MSLLERCALYDMRGILPKATILILNENIFKKKKKNHCHQSQASGVSWCILSFSTTGSMLAVSACCTPLRGRTRDLLLRGLLSRRPPLAALGERYSLLMS